MVTEESSTENKSQVQTPTNYHQHIEIQNTKSKSRAEKSKSHSIRPTVEITENYNITKIEYPVGTIPESRLYSSTTKYDKKMFVVGDSLLKKSV